MREYYESVLQAIQASYADCSLEEQDNIFREAASLYDEKLKPRGLQDRGILLIGGAGYIGAVLTRYLLGHGYRVRCLDALVYRNESTVYPFLYDEKYEFMYGDLANQETVAKALEGMTDVVILAGLVGDPITKKYPEASDIINAKGMTNLIEAFNGKGLNKVLFISTCSNYGMIEGDQLADENFELKPLSLYAKAKVEMEKTLLEQKGRVDYHGTVLRFATAFGLSPRMRFDLTVSEFTRDLFIGKELLVYDADTWRPYCHVMDFSRAIRLVLEAPRERISYRVFNAGGDVNNYTKKMIIDAIQKYLPEAKVAYQEKGPDPRNYRVDFSRIQETLNFTPAYTVEDGIRELLDAMRLKLFVDINDRRIFHGNYEIYYDRNRL